MPLSRPYFAIQSAWRCRRWRLVEVRPAVVGGDRAEVAETHSRCNRDGVHLGSRMVRCGHGAALAFRLQCRRPVPACLRCTRLHCRRHILGHPHADGRPSHVRSVVAFAFCSLGWRGRPSFIGPLHQDGVAGCGRRARGCPYIRRRLRCLRFWFTRSGKASVKKRIAPQTLG